MIIFYCFTVSYVRFVPFPGPTHDNHHGAAVPITC